MSFVSRNYLLKEECFRKVNAELELKSSKLMKEVESVMNLQSVLNKEVSSDTVIDASKARSTFKRHENFEAQKHVESRYYSDEIDVTKDSADVKSDSINHNHSSSKHDYVDAGEDNVISEIGKGFGIDGVQRFLKGKLKSLEQELDILHKDYKKKTEDWHHSQKQLKQAEEDCKKWYQRSSTLKDQNGKLEQQISSLSAKLQQTEGENTLLKKELETVKRELKTIQQNSTSNETRLSRCLEELETQRNVLKQVKLDEKELKESNRKKTEELFSLIKKLERQKGDLMHGFKKQLQLIDNLKKQKAYIEACKAIQFTEEDFMKLLKKQ